MAERKVENHRENAAGNGRPAQVPREIGITDDRGAGEADCIREGSVEQVDCGDKTAHVLGGARVCDSVGGDVDEEFGDAADGVGDCDPLLQFPVLAACLLYLL